MVINLSLCGKNALAAPNMWSWLRISRPNLECQVAEVK